MTRARLAAGIVVLWLVALGWLAYRQANKTDRERLAEAAGRVEPAAYYYKVYQGGAQVGVASSVIDTLRGRIRTTDFFRGRLIVTGDTQTVEASAIAYLSARMSLDSFAIAYAGEGAPLHIRGGPKGVGAPLYLPTFTPVALMLTGKVSMGRESSYWAYNPIAQDVQRATLRVQAESLFTVSDSARYDSVGSRWVSAHQDTVRAWSVAPATSSYTVWVDAGGRIVSASEAGGLHIMRSAYEEAFSNWRLQQQR